jgi:hypothetical protein
MSDFAAGFFAPWIIYAVMLGLHLVLPARKVVGYVSDPATGEPLRYRLNGLLVLLAVVVLWVVTAATGVLAWDWLYAHRWSGLIGALPWVWCSAWSRWPLRRPPAAVCRPNSTSVGP